MKQFAVGDHGNKLVNRDENDFIAAANRNSLQQRPATGGFVGGRRGADAFGFFSPVIIALQTFARAVDGPAKPRRFDRFEDVIDGIDFEGANGVFVVCGYEGHEGRPVLLEEPDNAQAVDLGHLEIQKRQIGPFGFDDLDSFHAIGSFADDLDVIERSQYR